MILIYVSHKSTLAPYTEFIMEFPNVHCLDSLDLGPVTTKSGIPPGSAPSPEPEAIVI